MNSFFKDETYKLRPYAPIIKDVFMQTLLMSKFKHPTILNKKLMNEEAI